MDGSRTKHDPQTERNRKRESGKGKEEGEKDMKDERKEEKYFNKDKKVLVVCTND